MLVETCTGEYIDITIRELRTASRKKIIQYLESRGVACYDDEPTDLLRQAAVEDVLSESDGSV